MNAFDVMEGMLILEQNGKGIKEFFTDNGVDKVLLYGFGRVGQCVYGMLLKAGVCIEAVIDKDAELFEAEGVQFVEPSHIKGTDNSAELIVVTPMEHYHDIKDELSLYTDKDIISIGEIVEYCMDGESGLRIGVTRKIPQKKDEPVEDKHIRIDREGRSRKILVFGGGSGIGHAIAKRMADEGSNVVIAGRTEEKLKNAVREIGKDSCTFITADISMVNEHDRYFRKAADQMGGLDAFVNAAAISLESRGRGYEPWDIKEEEWDEMSDTDFKAAFFLMRNEVDYLKKKGVPGNILNIASNAPFMDVTGLYGASKQAVIRWTRSFGKRFGHDGIIINGIAPGITATSFVSDYIIKKGSSFPRHAIERIIMPEEVAELAAYCLGDRGVILCGCTVIADGGDAEAVF